MDYLLCAVTSLFIHGVLTLKLVRLEVPGAVERGDSIWLNCSFDLENDELYSVKWYKNNVEFYRYLPSDKARAIQKYDMPGVYVDLAKTEVGHLYLYRSDLHTEGVYRCEISAEAPSFQTVREEKELRVYVSPEGNPQLIGLRSHYQPGEDINVSCIAEPSKPLPTLYWTVNGRKVRGSPVESSDNQSAVSQAESRLLLTADPSHFQADGALRLECVSELRLAVAAAHDEIVLNNNTLLTGYRPSFLSSRERGPTISGEQPTYQVGDLVDLNCSTSYSEPPARLSWFLNNHQVTGPAVRDLGSSLRSGLRFRLHAGHFVRDELRVRCTSTQFRTLSRAASRRLYLVTQPPGLLFSKSTRQGFTHSQAALPILPLQFFTISTALLSLLVSPPFPLCT